MQSADCPGYENGCRCRGCYGLAEYMVETTGDDHGLPRTVRLRVVTAPLPLDAVPHDGTMTCPCEACVIDRTSRRALGAGPAALKVKPPRHLRAA